MIPAEESVAYKTVQWCDMIRMQISTILCREQTLSVGFSRTTSILYKLNYFVFNLMRRTKSMRPPATLLGTLADASLEAARNHAETHQALRLMLTLNIRIRKNEKSSSSCFCRSAGAADISKAQENWRELACINRHDGAAYCYKRIEASSRLVGCLLSVDLTFFFFLFSLPDKARSWICLWTKPDIVITVSSHYNVHRVLRGHNLYVGNTGV